MPAPPWLAPLEPDACKDAHRAGVSEPHEIELTEKYVALVLEHACEG